MLEPIKGLDPGYLLPSSTKSFVHLSVCESANTCPLEFWHLWGSIQGYVVPLFDSPAWAGHQHLNAKKVRLTQKFHKLRNIYFPLVKSMQSLNIKTARPLWFLSLKKIKKAEFGTILKKKISRIRCFQCTVVEVEGNGGVWERQWWVNAMCTFRKPLPSMAGYVRRHHSLACTAPKIQTESKENSSPWPEVGV